MGSSCKLFFAFLWCLALTVVHIYGELVMLKHPADDTDYSSRQNYTCISEDDGAPIIWYSSGNFYYLEDFKRGIPAIGDVRYGQEYCAIRKDSMCLTNWAKTRDWRVVNSATKPTGPVFNHHNAEDFKDIKYFDTGAYKKVGVVNKSSSTVWISGRGINIRSSGVLLCEKEKLLESQCLWIRFGYHGIVFQSCDAGDLPSDGSLSDAACHTSRTIDTTLFSNPDYHEWYTFRLEWNTQQQTVKMFQGNNSEPFVEGTIPKWDKVSAVGVTTLLNEEYYGLRFQFFDYRFTDTKNAVISTRGFEHSGKMFCAELSIGLCPKCKLNVTLVNGDGSEVETWPFTGDGQDPYNGLLAWRLVKMNTRFDSDIPRRLSLKIETILDGDEGAGEWAIDNFRMCQPGTQRDSTRTFSSYSNVACQKLSLAGNSLIEAKMNDKITNTKIFSQVQEFLRPRIGPLVGKGGFIYSPSGYFCDQGFTGRYCDEECDDGFYGFDCTQICGFCGDSEPCNKSTGFCDAGCYGNMVAPFCKTALFAPTVEDDTGTTATVLQTTEVDEDQVPHKIEVQIREAAGETWVNFTAILKDSDETWATHEAHITGLKPNTSYAARAVTVVSVGATEEPRLTFGPHYNFTTLFEEELVSSRSSIPSENETEFTGPATSMVNNLRISEDKGRVEWDKPADCTTVTGPTEVARLFFTRASDSALIKEVQTSNSYFNLSEVHLEPLTWYKVRVHVVAGYDEPENPDVYQELTWRTNLEDVEAPTVVNVTQSTARIIQNVNFAGHDGKIFVTFILREVWTNDSFASLATHTTGDEYKLDVKNLKPNVLYKVYSLITILESDRTATLDSSPIVFKTKCLDTPYFEVSPSAESLSIINVPSRPQDCKHPANQSYSVKVYDVAENSLASSFGFSQLPATAEDLNPDTAYKVEIWIRRQRKRQLVFTTKVRTTASEEASVTEGIDHTLDLTAN